MSNVVTAQNGQQLDLDNLPHTLTYSGTLIATDSVVLAGVTYVQTFGNNGTSITTISRWVNQS